MGLNDNMENESISKELEAALNSFKTKSNQVPEGYFDQFEVDVMQKIQANKSSQNKVTIISLFARHKKYLVAASLFFAIATGYLFYNSAENKTATMAQVDVIDIETLPDELIEAYVSNNELIAEVEWNSAIENAGTSISSKNN
jgi:hypothetical protein